MQVTDDIFIDESELEERFVRASGPGGQHVNKTSSAVQLRFDAAISPGLSAEVKFRLRRVAGRRMTKDGVLVIEADGSRSQERNRSEARQKLADLIIKATYRPKPRKTSRPSLTSIRKMKEAKAKRGKTKAMRRKPGRDD
ncbi:MAG: aminoacyl-tRNA hydrolase [Hyphobacterium sp.]|nr:MAG: aminoacyl-tRNA hydrolase [Hyphobacterium sp.]